MYRLLTALIWLMALPVFGAHLDGAAPAPAKDGALSVVAPAVPAPNSAATPTRVLVIPVRDQIADPVLYILRRGLKTADAKDLVVLDMKTPGGAVSTTFEIAEALAKFKGRKLTYVNDEAWSAGALIASMTDDIYFKPGAVMGAAAAVNSNGEDIGKTMKLKVNSVLLAKVRSWAEGKGRYRGQVLSAMIDEDFEFKIGETIIKAKGSLLSVNSTEAAKSYGEPPEALLSAGTFATLPELLDARLGAGNYRIERIEPNWSEQLAQYIANYSPVFLGLGMLCLFIEFKTAGFGVFGIVGGALLLIVFFGGYAAGLSGYEPALVFVLGLLLLLCELIFFPGVVIVALAGVLLMFGALLWSMADLWPNEPVSVSADAFLKPLRDLGLGLLVALTLGLLLAKFIPKGWFFSRLAVAGATGGAAQLAGIDPASGAAAGSLIGARGVVVTGLFPSGQIEIDGRRYEARVEVGAAAPGAVVVVQRVADFNLIVEVANS